LLLNLFSLRSRIFTSLISKVMSSLVSRGTCRNIQLGSIYVFWCNNTWNMSCILFRCEGDANLVSRYTTTHMTSIPLFSLGNPDTNFIIISSHFTFTSWHIPY
jgi:hypothetical protein